MGERLSADIDSQDVRSRILEGDSSRLIGAASGDQNVLPFGIGAVWPKCEVFGSGIDGRALLGAQLLKIEGGPRINPLIVLTCDFVGQGRRVQCCSRERWRFVGL